MRYKLDEKGYFCTVYIGCSGIDCSEYNGTIPDGFLSNIKAYKLVDGVITYDEARAAECASRCASECEDYHYTSKKEVLELIDENGGAIDISLDESGKLIVKKGEDNTQEVNLPSKYYTEEEVEAMTASEKDIENLFS